VNKNLNSSEFWLEESDWLIVVRLHVHQANTFNMANWSDREIETVIEGMFTRVGYPAVNLEQLDAVIVKGKDVFFSVPTGSGKSLCYSILLLMFDSVQWSYQRSIIVVISPLKALMLDQLRAFTAKDVNCTYINAPDDTGDLLN